jgi:hypothetical protein
MEIDFAALREIVKGKYDGNTRRGGQAPRNIIN